MNDIGSRLPKLQTDGRCIQSSGRSYNEEDIRQTGAVNSGEALRLLDPRITTGR